MKSWYRSRTVWLAIITGVTGVVNALTEGVTDPKVLSFLLAIVSVLNLALRFVTTQPISTDKK